MVVYDKELERTLRARKLAFETATKQSGHEWHEIDLAPVFAEWMAQDDYRDEYFASPEDLQLKLDAEFPDYVAQRLRERLTQPDVRATSVVAVFGVGAIFGFARISHILNLVESDIRGRLVVFFLDSTRITVTACSMRATVGIISPYLSPSTVKEDTHEN